MTSADLLLLIGGYAVIAALGMLRAPRRMLAAISDLRANPTLCFVSGAFTFFLGGMMFVLHSGTGNLGVIANVLAALIVLKGALLLLVPDELLQLYDRSWSEGTVRAWAIFVAGLGVLLVIFSLA